MAPLGKLSHASLPFLGFDEEFRGCKSIQRKIKICCVNACMFTVSQHLCFLGYVTLNSEDHMRVGIGSKV